jgi:hypothetical protein
MTRPSFVKRLAERLRKESRRPREEPATPGTPPPPAAEAAPIRLSRNLVSRSRREDPRPRRPTGIPLPGVEVRVGDIGSALLVESRAAAPDPRGDPATAGLLFFDLETTGLASSPLFLAGMMTWSGERLEVRQAFARDYSEEAAVIELFRREAEARARLVSFNGKSFDLPYLRARAAATGTAFAIELPHTDLLHAARREFRSRLPDCRLATLETRILGQPPREDIPGAEIPAAYHEYVRTGDATLMAKVLEHNRRDLLTMASLLVRLEV